MTGGFDGLYKIDSINL